MNDQMNLSGKRVLAVDDEPDVVEMLEEILNTCRVDTASSYENARELLENRDDSRTKKFIGGLGMGED